MATTKIPVRKLFWEALEMALETQTHRLAKDVAAVLGVPDAPLLKALREEKVSVMLFDESADAEVDDLSEHRCQHFVAAGPFWRRCGEPVVWSPGPKTQCLFHSLNPCLKADGPAIHAFEDEDDGSQYYVNRETKAVYTADGTLCGRLSEEGGVVELFDVT